MQTEKFYANKVCPRGSDLYYSLLYMQDKNRLPIIALHAFYQEVFNTLLKCSEYDVMQKRFQWWREEVSNFSNANASHPILLLLSQFDINPDLLINIVINIERYAYGNTFATIYEQQQTIIHSAGYREELCASTLLTPSSNIPNTVFHELALGLEIINHIHYLRTYLQSGILPFSLELLENTHCAADNLFQLEHNEKTKGLLSQQAKVAKTHINIALTHLPKSKQTRYFHTKANIQLKLLSELEYMDFNVFTYQIKLNPLRKLWLARRNK